MQKKYILGAVAALILTVNGCGKKAEAPKPQVVPAPASVPAPSVAGVTVSTITLGNALGAGKQVTQASNTFGRQDTIYASIDTTGAGTATLKAKWTFRKGGQETLVKEDSQTIAPTGPASTEFHISKPGGWPAGEYQVEIFMSDKSAGAKTFTVK